MASDPSSRKYGLPPCPHCQGCGYRDAETGDLKPCPWCQEPSDAGYKKDHEPHRRQDQLPPTRNKDATGEPYIEHVETSHQDDFQSERNYLEDLLDEATNEGQVLRVVGRAVLLLAAQANEIVRAVRDA